MNDRDKDYCCRALGQIADLLRDYERYRKRNVKKIKKQIYFMRGCLCAAFCAGVVTTAFSLYKISAAGRTDYGDALFGMVLLLVGVDILIVTTIFCSFRIEWEKIGISKGELEIYRNNKEAFAFIKDLSFPRDYLCSGFAQSVLKEVRQAEKKPIDDIYARCKLVNFDILSDDTARYIACNRNYVQKIQSFMGI